MAATGSFLDARHAGGSWFLRMDDLDTPRVRAGAESQILRVLETLGLHWDGVLQRQSEGISGYLGALEQLRSAQLLYACDCRRRETAGRVYPGTCRERGLGDGAGRALRMRAPVGTICIHDERQADICMDVATTTGDFIVRRSDGLVAYHLTCVVADAQLGVTHVVRGADLLESAAPQCVLYDALVLPRPCYLHLPLATDADGKKLGKSLGAEEALLRTRPGKLLLGVLKFLGQAPDAALADAQPGEILAWASAHWRREALPAGPAAPPPPDDPLNLVGAQTAEGC